MFKKYVFQNVYFNVNLFYTISEIKLAKYYIGQSKLTKLSL